VRYHTPEVKKYISELARYRESLEAAADRAFLRFLKEITATYYVAMRNGVNSLANADCLMSLAQIASQDGYVQPQFIKGNELEIIDGRHPMIEILKSDPFIPNSCTMGGDSQSTIVITGPNMGGRYKPYYVL
jgi:DNA mismatch repair protein MSH3